MPAEIDDEVAADFELLGVTLDREPDDDEKKAEKNVVQVWDSNWPALLAFLACETQWRVVARGMSGVKEFLGIDYAAADVVLRRQKAKNRVFEDLRVMERAALDTFEKLAASGAEGT